MPAIVEKATPTIVIKVIDRFFKTFDFAFTPIISVFEVVERIQMNVMQDEEEIRITINEFLFGTSLEKYATTLMSFIIIMRVADTEFTGEFRDATLDDFRQKQMEVIVHETPPMNIDKSFPFARLKIRRCDILIFEMVFNVVGGGGVVEFVEAVDEAYSIAVINTNIPLVDTSVVHMKKLDAHENKDMRYPYFAQGVRVMKMREGDN